MKLSNKKLCVVPLFLIIIFMFNSCYHFETSLESQYDTYYQKLQEASPLVAEFLPESISEDCIEDMYIFYSDRDLLDSYHTVYLNCKYTEEEYLNEKNRISELYVDEDLLVVNSEQFTYESLMYGDTLSYEKIQVGDLYNSIRAMLMDFEYVLFDENEFRVVYVSFFDKELYGKSTNIPEEYLPKDLVDLRREGNDSIVH